MADLPTINGADIAALLREKMFTSITLDDRQNPLFVYTKLEHETTCYRLLPEDINEVRDYIDDLWARWPRMKLDIGSRIERLLLYVRANASN